MIKALVIPETEQVLGANHIIHEYEDAARKYPLSDVADIISHALQIMSGDYCSV